MIRRTVYYSGHVQGVGFRAVTASIARNYRVSGFVRNLPDGRVELVAESSPEELSRFLNRIAERFRDHIRRADSHDETATGEFSDLEIRF